MINFFYKPTKEALTFLRKKFEQKSIGGSYDTNILCEKQFILWDKLFILPNGI